MNELILTSLKAHQKWVVTRITNDKARVAYESTMQHITDLFNYYDYEYASQHLLTLSREYQTLYPNIKNISVKYRFMALEHAIDVYETLINRMKGHLR